MSRYNDRTSRRNYATPQDTSQLKEYAFEMAASSIRFGPGVTQEVGMDIANLNPTGTVAVITDSTVEKLDAMRQVRESLDREGIKYKIFNKVKVEPKDYSIKEAIDWARTTGDYSVYLAVGGGSVIDTAKLMNLYSVYKDADFMDFVNAPLGKGRPVDRKLYPLIAVPTTAGTGSETTGTAIFDLVAKKSKTGIAHRNLKPYLGICDPLNTRTMPSAVKASSGLDVLCHALESYTAIPFNERTPRPTNPILRPAYQGANPISDIFSLNALRQTAKYLPRSVKDPEDTEAQTEMLLAATLAGVGFGNAGVHLCHGASLSFSFVFLPLPLHPPESSCFLCNHSLDSSSSSSLTLFARHVLPHLLPKHRLLQTRRLRRPAPNHPTRRLRGRDSARGLQVHSCFKS